jgi:hypothetical protein
MSRAILVGNEIIILTPSSALAGEGVRITPMLYRFEFGRLTPPCPPLKSGEGVLVKERSAFFPQPSPLVGEGDRCGTQWWERGWVRCLV